MKSQLACALLLLTVLVWAAGNGCGSGGGSGASAKLRVVATTTQIGDMTANVGGGRIALTVLLKPNQDAHDFDPAPSQLRAIQEADVILRNGLGLDTFVSKAIGGSGGRVVLVSDGVPLRDNDGRAATASADEAAGYDPHIWFSVENAVTMVRNIRDALAAADPSNAAVYRESASRYTADLAALDARIRTQVQQVPAACRKLVTNHDTLGYYAHAYGFTIAGSVIPSVSSQAKPSAADIGEIVRKIREANVPAIFAEASLNPSLIRQVGREAGVSVVDDLYGDSLGPKGSPGGTYIRMMESNTAKIVDALKGCGT